MSDSVLKPQLWTERPVAETMAVYADWARRYDDDVTARGYHTPGRVAEALLRHLPLGDDPVLDFGCGTGLSGLALKVRGVPVIHGTDMSPEMVARAEPKGIYDRLWVSDPGVLDVPQGTLQAIVATGVVSLGAAPAETMDILIDALTPGGLLAMSFNDPTLAHGGYDAHLDTQLQAGRLDLIERAHGPHLDDVPMGSDVMVLRRR